MNFNPFLNFFEKTLILFLFPGPTPHVTFSLKNHNHSEQQINPYQLWVYLKKLSQYFHNPKTYLQPSRTSVMELVLQKWLTAKSYLLSLQKTSIVYIWLNSKLAPLYNH